MQLLGAITQLKYNPLANIASYPHGVEVMLPKR